MSIRYMQFMVGYGDIVASPMHMADPLTASTERNFVSNITINKTWHASCRTPAVSKILDWLV